MGLFLITLGVFGVAMLIMAVGVILQGRCLRGSCGGPEVLAPDGTSLNCPTCPQRKERQARQAERLAVLGHSG